MIQSALMEFHVARAARDLYQFDDTLFAYDGNVIFANFHAARVFAQKMNDRRDLIRFPEQAVSAGQLNAMGLLDELLHHVLAQYRAERNPDAMKTALAELTTALGAAAVDKMLTRFCDEFPPVAVYRGEQSVADYLAASTAGVSHREAALEEMIFLWLSNQNPALTPYRELFADDDLAKLTAYRPALQTLETFFADQPGFGPNNLPLLDLLLEPARRFPHSLTEQLEYVRGRWSTLLGKYLYRLLGSLDLIAEEERMYFGVGGPGPVEVIDFEALRAAGDLEPEPERFSADLDWMPRLVLVAKNTYVWLDQLSKKHGRTITRLDQIPDEELDFLAQAGFTGLWLIGLWERSEASRRIKHLCGNPDAVASAYSLDDYAIAAGLGGDHAYDNLRQRARSRGIRMSSDMVPNHMGVDSRWVVEHPDWFVQVPYSPYPSYTFNGPDLSHDERVGIFLEDHYYSRSDAAVVFKRVDRWTGDESYIYHGNDGTSMPWNDTAQLNFLLAEVREAVIQTILHVARRSSVIRFDAAMVLAKKHIQRLWFPEPGTGGGVPSRAEFGMSKSAFDQQMPVEFWREVVDRVAQEEPDTLLLAEAFWLMEGFFVRTLGMHRVYNSAFMHMMRDEKNGEYRLVMKNTLEFNPEILKRYVNFMNNPDEETAVEQFGKGDKYFGVATMMATLPGLPMIGHGQVEGFTEKYGMEYQRAYYDERPDEYLVDRHRREIFPLFHKRYLFADVEHFLLYDFYTESGQVNEDVFAHSNRFGDEHALVLYHNRWATAVGWLKSSVAYSVPVAPDSEERTLVQRTLADGLDLPADLNAYVVFRDHMSGLEYIRNCHELTERGLYVELGAYKYHVFLDFRVVYDDETHRYARLNGYLNGRGVPNVEEALQEILLEPVLRPFRKLVTDGAFQRLLGLRNAAAGDFAAALTAVDEQVLTLLRAIQNTAPPAAPAAGGEVEVADNVETEDSDAADPVATVAGDIQALLTIVLQDDVQAPPDLLGDEAPANWGTLFSWIFVHGLGRLAAGDPAAVAGQSRSWLDEWLLGKVIGEALRELGQDEGAAARSVTLIKLLTSQQHWYAAADLTPYRALSAWLSDPDGRRFLGVNRHEDVLWFNQESFAELLDWLALVAGLLPRLAAVEDGDGEDGEPAGAGQALTIVEQLRSTAGASGYQVEKLLDLARRAGTGETEDNADAAADDTAVDDTTVDDTTVDDTTVDDTTVDDTTVGAA